MGEVVVTSGDFICFLQVLNEKAWVCNFRWRGTGFVSSFSDIELLLPGVSQSCGFSRALVSEAGVDGRCCQRKKHCPFEGRWHVHTGRRPTGLMLIV